MLQILPLYALHLRETEPVDLNMNTYVKSKIWIRMSTLHHKESNYKNGAKMAFPVRIRYIP
jgi:hypothetical protein